MCYISPFYNTPLAVFKDFDFFFQGRLGRYPGRIVSIIIYIIALVLGGGLIYGTSRFVKKNLTGRRNEDILETETARSEKAAVKTSDFSYNR